MPFPSLLNQAQKRFEKMSAIVGARRSLRMVLDTQPGEGVKAQSFYRAIIEINMRYRGTRFIYARRINRKAMVLCGYLHTARDKVFHWLIGSAMSYEHLENLKIFRERHQLMP